MPGLGGMESLMYLILSRGGDREGGTDSAVGATVGQAG